MTGRYTACRTYTVDNNAHTCRTATARRRIDANRNDIAMSQSIGGGTGMRIGGTRSILVFHTIDKKDIGRTLRIGLSRKCDTVIVRTKGIRACIGTEANSWFARTWIELSRIAGLCTIGYITCSIVNGIGL